MNDIAGSKFTRSLMGKIAYWAKMLNDYSEQGSLTISGDDLVSLAYTFAAARARIAELERENADKDDEIYGMKAAPWPEWAARIAHLMREYGAIDPSDSEIDLGEVVATWVEGYDPDAEKRAEKVARAINFLPVGERP